MLATDGIAAQLQDIPRAFRLFEQLPLSERREAVLTAQAELGKRRAGNDKFTSQMTGSNESGGATRVAILLALNSSWDQAALGLHAVFANNTAWIVETVRWALDCTPHEIIVRQHPAERLENGRTSDDYRALLTREFGTHPRLRFVAAGDPVNTYDLLRSAAVVVAYTSTFGVEASALGNVVIVPSRCYYADLGFVWKADSRTLYFSLIEQAMGGELTVTQAMKDRALWCYYLAQVRNWIFSPFNPEGYNDWSKLTIEEIEKEPAVQVYLPSLIDNIPAAYTNHTIGAH